MLHVVVVPTLARVGEPVWLAGFFPPGHEPEITAVHFNLTLLPSSGTTRVPRPEREQWIQGPQRYFEGMHEYNCARPSFTLGSVLGPMRGLCFSLRALKAGDYRVATEWHARDPDEKLTPNPVTITVLWAADRSE